MGSKEFQTEYIQYLQDNNTKLMKKLSEMQENFENKVCYTDTSKQYLLATLAETLNICTVLPQEIDSLFEKITGAIVTLKNILIKKSELVQLAQKISQIVEPYKNMNEESPDVTSFPNRILNPKSAVLEKKEKGGTVKVSPMIDGHIISTEPKICLNRISKMQVPQQLSPILETSTGSPLESPKSQASQVRLSPNLSFNKEPETPLQRFFKEKVEKQDQIKKKFQLPRNEKKNLTKRNSHCGDNNRVNETLVLQKQNETESQNQSGIDPLEGSSWLYTEACDISTSANGNFVNTRRRRNPFIEFVCKSENFDFFNVENENYLEPLVILEEPTVNNFNKENFENDSQALSTKVPLIDERESLTSSNTQQSKSNSLRQNSFLYIEETIKKKLFETELKDKIIKNQPFVKLEDCLSKKKNFSQSFNNISIKTESSENSSGSFKWESNFCNTTTPDEGEGRKKRKAAPKNLAEPKLKPKLRRE